MNYWLSFVFGNFGSWKTFGTFLELYDLDPAQNYILANVPYSVVDHYWSTTSELLNIFDILGQYSEETNKDIKKYYDTYKNQKDIVLIVDESHLYLDSRDFASKNSIIPQLKTILTQVRKRKVKILYITQRLTTVDIFIRRLADYVVEYNRKVFLHKSICTWVTKKVYENQGDIADIQTENKTVTFDGDGNQTTLTDDALVSKELFFPLTTFFQIFSFFSKTYRRVILEEHKTLHISWFNDSNVQPLVYTDFVTNLWSIPYPFSEQTAEQQTYQPEPIRLIPRRQPFNLRSN